MMIEKIKLDQIQELCKSSKVKTLQGRCKSYKSRRLKNSTPEFTVVNEDVKFLIQR
jgi:hypothetical protein